MKAMAWVLPCLLWAHTAQAAPGVIYVARHAEKADNSKDPPLSAAGQERARALASVLSDAGITHVMVTQYQRTRLTAQPTLDALRLTAIQVPADPHDETLKRLADLKPTDRVLVVAHSDTIPVLLQKLNASTQVTLGHNDYDQLFVVVPRGPGSAEVTRLHVGPPSPAGK